MISRLASLCFLAAVLAGCNTVQNPLAQQQIESLRLATVNVAISDTTTLWWGDGDRAFARSKGRSESDAEELSKTPEARAFIANAVTAKISAALEQQLKPVLAGQRPVKVVVHLRRLYMASVIQRLVVGGHHELIADVMLVDAKTGSTILAYPDFRTIALAGQGIGGTLVDAAVLADPIDRLTQNFATTYRDWLLPKQPN